MRPLIGIHLHQRKNVDIERLIEVGFECYTVLHLDADFYISALKRVNPAALILIRQYHSDVMFHSPLLWARQCAASVSKWRDWCCHELKMEGDCGIQIVGANELNLAVEHGRSPSEADFWDVQAFWESEEGYSEINNWILAWAIEMKNLVPWCKLHFPAFSPGHREDGPDKGFIGYKVCRPAIEACDILDIHAYWNADGTGLRDDMTNWYAFRWRRPEGYKSKDDPGGARAIFPKKTIFISEYNRMVDRASETDRESYKDEVTYYLEQVCQEKYVSGSTLFLWSSDDPQFANLQIQGQPAARSIRKLIQVGFPQPEVPAKRRHEDLPLPIFRAIENAASSQGLPLELLAAIIEVESNFAPLAYREEPSLPRVSDWEVSGDSIVDASLGLGQILRSTAKGWGIRGDANLYDPIANAELTAAILKHNLVHFHGDQRKAISAYNQGIAGCENRGWQFNRRYVERVLELSSLNRDHGFGPEHPPNGEIPQVIIEEDVIRLANDLWKRCGSGLFVGDEIHAFGRKWLEGFMAYIRDGKRKRQSYLGPPVGDTVDINGYRIQFFARGSLYAKIGDWQNVKEGLPIMQEQT